MHSFTNGRTFQRSFLIDQQPQNDRSIDSQVELDQTQNEVNCITADASNHAVSLKRDAVRSPPTAEINQVEGEFQHMSRTELEIFAHMKIVEANEYKYHFHEMDKKCNILRTSLDKTRTLYSEMHKKYYELKEHCDRFFTEVQRTTGDGTSDVRVENISAAAPPPAQANPR